MSDDEESEKEDEEKDDKESSESNSTRNNSNIITYENWVYKVSNQDNLKKYYLVVINKDIFYYKTDSKEELLGMHNHHQTYHCYIDLRTHPYRKGLSS